MIYFIHNKYRGAHWLPLDFEAMTQLDAQAIMQAWADRLSFGPLVFEWSGNGCGVHFWRNGIQYRFCTIISKGD